MLVDGIFQVEMCILLRKSCYICLYWFYANSCFIIQVITCGFPPLEDRDQSLKLLAGYDFFGGGTLKKEDTVSLSALIIHI